MNILEKTKQFLTERMLRKEQKKGRPRRHIMKLDDARRIGILFNMTDQEEYERVHNFARGLQIAGKQLKIIGLYDGKKTPPYYSHTLAYDLVMMQKHLDFLNRPKPEFVRSFIEEPLDILIDTTEGLIYPARYITLKSFAGFKVGRFTEDRDAPYDLMIHTDEETNLTDFFELVAHYLNAANFSTINHDPIPTEDILK